MNAMLIANHVSSLVVIVTCWWLSHSYAFARPPGRLIASGFSLIGFSVLFTALVRNLHVDPDAVRWLVVVTKSLLGMTFALVIYRRGQVGED